jgi:hypothetical protein
MRYRLSNRNSHGRFLDPGSGELGRPPLGYAAVAQRAEVGATPALLVVRDTADGIALLLVPTNCSITRICASVSSMPTEHRCFAGRSTPFDERVAAQRTMLAELSTGTSFGPSAQRLSPKLRRAPHTCGAMAARLPRSSSTNATRSASGMTSSVSGVKRGFSPGSGERAADSFWQQLAGRG